MVACPAALFSPIPFPRHVDNMHKFGMRIVPRGSNEFSRAIDSFQRHYLKIEDPAWRAETRPMLEPMMDSMIKKKMENHKSNYRNHLKEVYGEC